MPRWQHTTVFDPVPTHLLCAAQGMIRISIRKRKANIFLWKTSYSFSSVYPPITEKHPETQRFQDALIIIYKPSPPITTPSGKKL